MKLFKLLGGIFLLFGIGCFIGVIWSVWDVYNFISNSEIVDGKIIDIITRTSKDSEGNIVKRRYPVIQFTDKEGSNIEFESSSSVSGAINIGEIVKVRYINSNLKKAKLANSFTDMWGSSIIIGIFAIFLTTFGGIFFWIGIRDSIREKKALSYTKEVKAKINGVFPNKSISINGRNPFLIEAQWVNPDTNEIHIFKSKNFWYDPSEYLKEEEIIVKMDPRNPKKYWMDVSFLPKEA
ncbi:MAG: DUF3592 domain-containing protein [Chitinispirillaceae bacterium]|nr:DUF3592 domain-containing protein [Chitinispirillaceae bacterium]